MWIQAQTHISEREREYAKMKKSSYCFNDNLVYLKKKKNNN